MKIPDYIPCVNELTAKDSLARAWYVMPTGSHLGQHGVCISFEGKNRERGWAFAWRDAAALAVQLYDAAIRARREEAGL